MSHLTGDIVGFFNGIPVRTAVRYYPDINPYAIEFIFHANAPISWTFSRDLLSEGLDVPTGQGDVKFRPTDEQVIMSISSDNGITNAEFVFQKTDIQAIVSIAEQMMPRGKEGEAINWDAELESLLNGGTMD